MGKVRMRLYSLILAIAANRIAALEFHRELDRVACNTPTSERLSFTPAFAFASQKIGQVNIPGWLETDLMNCDYDIDAYRLSRLGNEMYAAKGDTPLQWFAEAAYLETGHAMAWLRIGVAKRLVFNSYTHITLLKRSNAVIISVNGSARSVVASSKQLRIGKDMTVAYDSVLEWRPYISPTAILQSEKAGCLFFQATDKIDGVSIEHPDGSLKMFTNELVLNKLEISVGVSVLNVIQREPDNSNSIIVFRALYDCQNEISLSNKGKITGCQNITHSTWKSTPACACYLCSIQSCTCRPCQNVGKHESSEKANHTTSQHTPNQTTPSLSADPTENQPPETPLNLESIQTTPSLMSIQSISQTPLPDLPESHFELESIKTTPLEISPEKISPTKSITHTKSGDCLSCEISSSSIQIVHFPLPTHPLEPLTTTPLVMSTASTTPASTHSTTSPTEDNNVNIAAGLGVFALLVCAGYACILCACKHLRRMRGARVHNGDWDYHTGHEQIQLARLPEPLPASQPRPEPQPLPAINEETEPTVCVDPPSANTCSPYVLTFVEEEQGLEQIPQPLLAMQPIPEPQPFPEPQPLSEQQPMSEPQPLSDQQPIAESQPLPEQQPIAEPQPLSEPLPPPAVESDDETVPKVLADPPSANIHSPYVLNFDVEGQGKKRRKIFRADTR